MQQVAEADHFRHIFLGLPSIGGRYSALSNFGMVPAAVMGLDIEPIPRPHRRKWSRPAEPAFPSNRIPGVVLGVDPRDRGPQRTRQGHHHHLARNFRSRRVARAVARRIHRQAGQGHHPGRSRRRSGRPRSTATIACSPTCAWSPRRTRRRTPRSPRSRRPGIRWCASRSDDIYDLGQEFFRWEIATAVAGSIIGINAFNQPDVEASKIATRNLTDGIREDRFPARGEARSRG